MAVQAVHYILTFYHHHLCKSMHIAQVSYSYKANSYFVLQVSFNLKYKCKYKIYLKNANHAFIGTVPQIEETAEHRLDVHEPGGQREGGPMYVL